MVYTKVSGFKTKGGKTVVATLGDLGVDGYVSRAERKELTKQFRADREAASKGNDAAKESVAKVMDRVNERKSGSGAKTLPSPTIKTSSGDISWLNPAIGGDSEAGIKKIESRVRVKVEVGNQYVKSLRKQPQNERIKKEIDRAKLSKQEQRLAEAMSASSAKRRVQEDKKLSSDFSQRYLGNSYSAAEIRYKAALTPVETVQRYSPSLAAEFKKYAAPSGDYWKDTRTGSTFKASEAITRNLIEQRQARQILGLPIDKKTDGGA